LLKIKRNNTNLPASEQIFNGHFQFEKLKRLMKKGTFAMRILTDGYGCSVNFKKNHNTQLLSSEMDLNNYHNKTIVGLDPGRRSIFTAAYLDYDFENMIDQNIKPDIEYWSYCDLSAGRWKHLTSEHAFKNRQKRWLEADIKNSEVIPANAEPAWKGRVNCMRFSIKHLQSTISSPAVTSLEKYKLHVKSTSFSTAKLEKYFFCHRELKLRFDSYSCCQKAYEKVLNELKNFAPNPVIAFGSAKFNYASSGSSPTPNSTMAKKIASMFQVVWIDEFRTSRLCCECSNMLQGTHNWSVKICIVCKKVVNRDVNAAINIAEILEYEIKYGCRKPAFSRTKNPGILPTEIKFACSATEISEKLLASPSTE
jgi:Putative transposase DNA-binding domain